MKNKTTFIVVGICLTLSVFALVNLLLKAAIPEFESLFEGFGVEGFTMEL